MRKRLNSCLYKSLIFCFNFQCYFFFIIVMKCSLVFVFIIFNMKYLWLCFFLWYLQDHSNNLNTFSNTSWLNWFSNQFAYSFFPNELKSFAIATTEVANVKSPKLCCMMHGWEYNFKKKNQRRQQVYLFLLSLVYRCLRLQIFCWNAELW